jgi:hypothetical protein
MATRGARRGRGRASKPRRGSRRRPATEASDLSQPAAPSGSDPVGSDSEDGSDLERQEGSGGGSGSENRQAVEDVHGDEDEGEAV